VSSTWSINLPELVIVTGSASGLGAECALKLLEAGTQVIGIDLAAGNESLISNHSNYQHVQASTIEPETWSSVREILVSSGKRSYGYIGCAATLQPGTLSEESLDPWRDAWEINVGANILAVKSLLEMFKSAQFASVVAVSSVNATYAEQDLGAYSSSKAALSAAFRNFAVDFATSEINFNILSPGAMKAGLFNRHLNSAHDPEKFLEAREARQPKGRITEVGEVADVAMFLVSKQSSALLGSTVTADGGLTASFDFRTETQGARTTL